MLRKRTNVLAINSNVYQKEYVLFILINEELLANQIRLKSFFETKHLVYLQYQKASKITQSMTPKVHQRISNVQKSQESTWRRSSAFIKREMVCNKCLVLQKSRSAQFGVNTMNSPQLTVRVVTDQRVQKSNGMTFLKHPWKQLYQLKRTLS